MNEIPLVDFTPLGLDQDDISENDWKLVSDKIYKAISEIGFVYLKGHGIPKELIQECFRVSKEFFDLPTEIKLKYERGSDNYGYSAVGVETLDPIKNQREIRETMNMNFPGNENQLPNEVPHFEDVVVCYFKTCGQLIQRILRAIGYGLELKDVDMLKKTHSFDNSVKNRTHMRFLHYPPVNASLEDTEITRCGEHSDYGSITILIQDEENGQGLQVKNLAGKYISAPAIHDTVLVNIGETMQRWTSDRLIATKHRVMIKPEQLNERRYSIACFGFPDDDILLECLDGSNKYPPMMSQDYLNMRFDQTYSYKHY